jgi:hypothetical protein
VVVQWCTAAHTMGCGGGTRQAGPLRRREYAEVYAAEDDGLPRAGCQLYLQAACGRGDQRAPV